MVMEFGAERSAQDGRAKPLTVLQLAPARTYGGLERTTSDVSAALIRCGGRALIAAPRTQAALRLRSSGAEIFEMEFDSRSPLRARANAKTLIEIAKREAVDVIHARDGLSAAAGVKAAAATGAAFVTTWASAREDHGFLARGFSNALASGRPVIAVSDFIARHLAEARGLGADRVVVVPRGVDMDAFSEDAVGAERAVRLADAWGLAEDPRPVILLPGRIAPGAGHRVMAAAAARLRAARGDDFLCLVVGEGGEKQVAEVEAQIASAGAAGVMRIAGPTPDMPAAIKLSSVVAAPAEAPRASARVLIEAQAMGRPVIAADHGAAPEVMKAGETGWAVPPGDADALAAAMGAALDMDESQRAHVGLSGRAMVRSRFTLSAMTDEVCAIYAEAAAAAS